ADLVEGAFAKAMLGGLLEAHSGRSFLESPKWRRADYNGVLANRKRVRAILALPPRLRGGSGWGKRSHSTPTLPSPSSGGGKFPPIARGWSASCHMSHQPLRNRRRRAFAAKIASQAHTRFQRAAYRLFDTLGSVALADVLEHHRGRA